MSRIAPRSGLKIAALAGLLILAAPRAAQAQEQGGGMKLPGLFAAGLLFSGIGVGGVATGGYFFSEGAGACDGISRDQAPTPAQAEACQKGVIQQLGGVTGLVTGGIFVVAGIPMMAVGASPEDEPPPSVSVRLGPKGGTFTYTF